MKFLFDFFPILLFFGVFKVAEMYEQASFAIATKFLGGLVAGGSIKPDQAPIMIATVVAIVATTLQLVYLKLRGRKIDAMLWVSFLIITIFGSMTIYFHDDVFIKWKPTIIYWVFAVVMCVAQFAFGKNLMRQAMETQIKLPEPVWKNVGLSWMVFFFVLGVVNLVAAFVIFKDNTSAWVSFKLFGINGLLFVFIIVQTLMLSKYIEAEEQA
ncbi:septation protein A [Massilia sp. P8910]|uniref:Inner membrane-spanning protein YciB n=1 Tax=Massilia antarctica TaxID=2765360 RepID=A0AA49A7C6_9BURK|nr:MULTISPECIES: septation protein A [Massilia]CUI02972.1 Intracellular septation protein IspA [Janthinobacterium sp. CG23_2]MCE3602444.1 septation protein A [Massilia antarctica]MCY0916263.1 septation protein A [Massilia sp. H27-R4]QPI48662.1 septation protein A [Massilia antarctica]CUU26758.1 Intracellular septation protein IspA [Janthinobacterium sp. CG23_2]